MTYSYYYLFLLFSLSGVIVSIIGLISGDRFKSMPFVFSNVLYMAASFTAVLYSVISFMERGNLLNLSFRIGRFFPAGRIILKFDPLSDFFILFIFSVFFYIALYQIKYIEKIGSEINTPLFSFLFGIMLISVYYVIISFNGFMFMIFWEIMAVSSYFLVMTKHYIKGTKRAAFLMAVIMEIGAMLIIIGLIILYLHANSFNFETLKSLTIPAYVKEIVFLLFLFGFGILSKTFKNTSFIRSVKVPVASKTSANLGLGVINIPNLCIL